MAVSDQALISYASYCNPSNPKVVLGFHPAHLADSSRQTCQSRPGKALRSCMSNCFKKKKKKNTQTSTTPPFMSHLESPIRLSAILRQLRPIHRSRRALFSTSTPRHLPSLPPTVPSTAQCPPSACSCADMPSGLVIDYDKQLSGTMPPYTQHVVIRTGKNDWSSKIEDEPGEMNFARELKALVNRGGKFHDVRKYLCYGLGFTTEGSWGEEARIIESA